MPTLTVIKHFDVIKNITAGFFPRSVDLFFIRSRFNNWKTFCNRIIMQLPRRLMLPLRVRFQERLPLHGLVYRLP